MNPLARTRGGNKPTHWHLLNSSLGPDRVFGSTEADRHSHTAGQAGIQGIEEVEGELSRGAFEKPEMNEWGRMTNDN